MKIDGNASISNNYNRFIDKKLIVNNNYSDKHSYAWNYEWEQDTGMYFIGRVKIDRVTGFFEFYKNASSQSKNLFYTENEKCFTVQMAPTKVFLK
jgi:hypothetical protein